MTPLTVVIAADSFKECLSAPDVCQSLTTGVLRACPSAMIRQVPMADGGQGTTRNLVAATGGELREVTVSGPYGEPVQAVFGLLGDGLTGVMEMAAASGLELIAPDRRNPGVTSTRGTGELLLAVASAGVRRIIVGIGGSGTNDGGAGMADALGYRLLDTDGERLHSGGLELLRLDRIERPQGPSPLDGIVIDIACDVTNPLTGPSGASHVYGPQKGADPGLVEQLDRALSHFAGLIERDLGQNVEQVPGAGAAGGLGAGLLAFTEGRLHRGVELVIDAVGLEGKLLDADLCLTGEGSIDRSSLFGKTAVGVARLCRTRKVPCVAVAGAINGEEVMGESVFTSLFSAIPKPCNLQTAIREAPGWLSDVAERITRLYLAGRERRG